MGDPRPTCWWTKRKRRTIEPPVIKLSKYRKSPNLDDEARTRLMEAESILKVLASDATQGIKDAILFGATYRFRAISHPGATELMELERWDDARTADEVSVVCSQAHVPPGVVHERERVAFGIVGVVEMATIGVLAALCGALARAEVSVFVISTYDTDWLIVRAEQFALAKAALEAEGHRIEGELPRS